MDAYLAAGAPARPRPGRFIVLEGGEAAGKSTQASLLAAALGAVLTREPGGTPLGEKVRGLLLDPDVTISDRAEALLFAAARAQHATDLIRPHLAAGRTVICDRYYGSSVAYQAYGRGLPPDEVLRLSTWGTLDLHPHVTVLIDVPDHVAAARLTSRGGTDRMEAAGAPFHHRVADGFRTLADTLPGWVRVNGVGTTDEVHQRVLAVVRREPLADRHQTAGVA